MKIVNDHYINGFTKYWSMGGCHWIATGIRSKAITEEEHQSLLERCNLPDTNMKYEILKLLMYV